MRAACSAPRSPAVSPPKPDTDSSLSDVSEASLQATDRRRVDGVDGVERDGIETVLADVTDLAQVEAVVARTVERYGRLDVLISNAGVLAPNGRIHNLTDADWSTGRSTST